MDEFVIEWLRGQTVAAITAPSASALKTKLQKLAADHPEECNCIENKDGSVFGHVPVKYIKVSPPRQLNFSEEQREKLRTNMKSLHDKRGQNRPKRFRR